MNNFSKSKINNLYIYNNAESLSLKSLDMTNEYYGNIILSNGDRKPFISNDDFFDGIFFYDKNFIKLDYPKNYDSILVTIPLNNNVKTFQKIDFDKEALRAQPMLKIRKYLREKNLIKIGTTAPDNVLRSLYESSLLAGDITNINGGVFMHNYMSKD